MTAGLDTFAKVRALHDRTESPGEKAAAMARMQALAGKAGMTVEQAVSKLDAPPVTVAAFRTVDMGDFFGTPYFREQMAERERERAARWREVLEEYGTEEAVFYPDPMEKALDEAAARFGAHPGWDAFPLSDLPPAIVANVEAAWPMLGTVGDAWEHVARLATLRADIERMGARLREAEVGQDGRAQGDSHREGCLRHAGPEPDDGPPSQPGAPVQSGHPAAPTRTSAATPARC